MANTLEALPGDVLSFMARDLDTLDIIRLRACSKRLHSNHHLQSVYRNRLIARPIFFNASPIELRDGLLYEGDNLERHPFFCRKTVKKVWATPVDYFVWCTDGLYQVKSVGVEKLDQFEGMTPINILMTCIPNVESSTLFHFKEGLYVSGQNNFGQLGFPPLGEDPVIEHPERLNFFNDKEILQVFSALEATLVLCSDGLYSFGEGEDGQLGLGEQLINVHTPTRIDFFNNKTILQVIVQDRGVFVLCQEGLFRFGRANINHEDEPLFRIHYTPVATEFFDNKTIFRLEANGQHRNPSVHCKEGIYEPQAARGGWIGMPRGLTWYPERPCDVFRNSEHPLVQQACMELLYRYFQHYGLFHEKRAQALLSRMFHCDGTPESLKAEIDTQLALYKPEIKTRRPARYDPKYFSTALHHKTKGPEWGLYHTLKKCEALITSVELQVIPEQKAPKCKRVKCKRVKM